MITATTAVVPGPMSLFMMDAKNTGDKIDYGQRFNNDVAEEVSFY